MIKNLLLFLVFVTSIISCEKPPLPNSSDILPPAQQGGIFILNEGGFNNGNASVNFYDFQNRTMNEDVFFTANNRHLGDVLQSMTINKGTAYLVLNNSKKIELIDATTFLSLGTINGFNSPRYMLLINDAKAYVTDMYDNSIAVVDLTQKTITKKISCAGSTEQLLMVNNKVYVTNTSQKSIYVYDPTTDLLIDSIQLSYGPNSIVLDKNNKIWVLCSGNQSKQINAGLFRINPIVDTVEFSLRSIYPEGIFGASKLCINGSGDKLYWLNNHVQSQNITDTAYVATPFIYSLKNNYYGINVDPKTNEIYLSDAIDFAQKSNVYIYSPAGAMSAFFKAGINTNGFYFNYK